MGILRSASMLYDPDLVSWESGLSCQDKSLTQQHCKDEADINVIVKRFGVTGTVPQNVRVPTYQDFGEFVFDYQSAMNALVMAQRSFESMSADVRKRFGNDPQMFLEFCSKEENLPEMRKMGLAVPAPPAPKPQEVRVINPDEIRTASSPSSAPTK